MGPRFAPPTGHPANWRPPRAAGAAGAAGCQLCGLPTLRAANSAGSPPALEIGRDPCDSDQVPARQLASGGGHCSGGHRPASPPPGARPGPHRSEPPSPRPPTGAELPTGVRPWAAGCPGRRRAARPRLSKRPSPRPPTGIFPGPALGAVPGAIAPRASPAPATDPVSENRQVPVRQLASSPRRRSAGRGPGARAPLQAPGAAGCVMGRY